MPVKNLRLQNKSNYKVLLWFWRIYEKAVLSSSGSACTIQICTSTNLAKNFSFLLKAIALTFACRNHISEINNTMFGYSKKKLLSDNTILIRLYFLVFLKFGNNDQLTVAITAVRNYEN